MLKVYNYVFYRCFKWDVKTHSGTKSPEYTAVFGMSASSFMYIIFVGFIANILGFKLFESLNKEVFLLAGFLIFTIHYLLFIRNKKYLDIIKLFNSKTDKNKTLNGWLVLLYLALPILGTCIIVWTKAGTN